MPSTHVEQRYQGVLEELRASYLASAPGSSNSKGQDREKALFDFLTSCLPGKNRVGSGEIIDNKGQISGQVDIVIQIDSLPSVPTLHGENAFYFAESVLMAIEVKSDISSQFNQALDTARKIKKLDKGALNGIVGSPKIEIPGIPMFLVSYNGWSNPQKYLDKLDENQEIDGFLCIKEGILVTRFAKVTGGLSLFAFMSIINELNNQSLLLLSNLFQYMPLGTDTRTSK